MTKVAFVEALPTLTGLATGYGPGRTVAGETAAALAPKGRTHRSENIARSAAVIGAPLGGLVAMGLARKYRLGPRLANFVEQKFPKGLIAEPSAEQELVNLGVPGVAAITGSLAGGGLTGGLVGGIQRMRGPTHHREKEAALKPSPMWGTVGGQASKPAWRSQAGFTPTGMKTPAQRLQRSMGMGKVDGSKGLKPLDLGKLQEAAEGVKMGSVMGAITPTSLIRDHIREDEEFGDELEPQTAKAAEDFGGHEGFTVSQYSGVMNPPKLPYASGIPGWREPPVKTTGEQQKVGMLSPSAQLSKAKAVGAPKLSTPPGPSIAQISKPKGYGMPLSGAKKGNNTI